VDGVVSGDLLNRLAATDRLHGDTGLELRVVGSALAHGGSPDQERGPASKVNNGAAPEKPVQLSQWDLASKDPRQIHAGVTQTNRAK
jgi:hypothetical protein